MTRGPPSRGQLQVWGCPLYRKHNLTEEEANGLSGAEEDRGKEQALSEEPGVGTSSLHSGFPELPAPALRSRHNSPRFADGEGRGSGKDLDQDIRALNGRGRLKSV